MSEELYAFQKLALEHLSHSGSHLICVAATGSGKSLIYERIAAKARTRMILVTPLVALARQQARQLRALDINTLLLAGSQDSLQDLGPKISACVVTPERFAHASSKNALLEWRPNFLVVDECHCIWEWGEDFRPSFRLLPALITEMQISKSLWLTATLHPDARSALKAELPAQIQEIGTFGLPTQLFIDVRKTPWPDRAHDLFQWVSSREDAGIIFVSTREATERVSRLVYSAGKRSAAYHAGMSQEERRNIEAKIREGKLDVVVCTSAFGMGMNYAHLKWVVLWQAPSSLLSLAQEIGRVSRAGQLGHAVIYWDHDDFGLHDWSMVHSEKKVAERKMNELCQIRSFLASRGCRRISLLEYFDPGAASQPCLTKCDYCISAKYRTDLITPVITRRLWPVNYQAILTTYRRQSSKTEIQTEIH